MYENGPKSQKSIKTNDILIPYKKIAIFVIVSSPRSINAVVWEMYEKCVRDVWTILATTTQTHKETNSLNGLPACLRTLGPPVPAQVWTSLSHLSPISPWFSMRTRGLLKAPSQPSSARSSWSGPNRASEPHSLCGALISQDALCGAVVWEMYEKCMSDACELARNSKPSKWYHFNSVPGSSRLHVRVLEGKIERQPLRTRTLWSSRRPRIF